jgi:hypothetical protein
MTLTERLAAQSLAEKESRKILSIFALDLLRRGDPDTSGREVFRRMLDQNATLTYSTNLPASRQKCVGLSCPTHWFQHETRAAGAAMRLPRPIVHNGNARR